MGLRICLVTPFAWSQPHVVNEHVDGVARELRGRGHAVTVLAPSGARATSPPAAARCLRRGDRGDRASAPAVPVSRRSSLGVPVGSRAKRSPRRSPRALRPRPRLRARAAEPLVPGATGHQGAGGRLLPLARAPRLPAAARRSATRLPAGSTPSWPPPSETRAAAAERFPGDYLIVSEGVDLDLFGPGRSERLIVLELAADRDRARARRASSAARARRLATRPAADEAAVGRALRPGSPARTASRELGRSGRFARGCSRSASIFVPVPQGSARRARGRAAGCAVADAARTSPSSPSSPPPPSRAWPRTRVCGRARRRGSHAPPSARASTVVAQRARRSVRQLGSPAPDAARAPRDPLGRPAVDRRRPAHAHLLVARLLDRGRRPARPRGGGRPRRDRGHRPQRLRRRARGRRARARTASCGHPGRGGQDRRPGRGDRALPRATRSRAGCRSPTRSPRSGSRAASSTCRTRSTGMHAIPDAATLHRHLARHRRASRSTTPACCSRPTTTRRSASRASTTSSPAQGRTRTCCRASGPARCACARSAGPEEFLLSLRSAEVLRRPKSLAYLQGLKWVAQAKERVR